MRIKQRNRRNLQRKLKKFFPDSSVNRGDHYFELGAVTSINAHENYATAEVIGSKLYLVSMDWTDYESNQAYLNCTCPHFQDYNLCKHLWAFILKLDEVDTPKQNISSLITKVEFGRPIKPQISNPSEHKKLKTPNLTTKSPSGMVNWRDTFIDTLSSTELSRYKKANTSDQKLFIVLTPDEYEENGLRIQFFKAFKKKDEGYKNPKPFGFSMDDDFEHPNLKLQSLINTIIKISSHQYSRHKLGHYRYGRYSNTSTYELNTTLARMVLPELLEHISIYVDSNDFLKSQTGEDLSLKLAFFENFCLKVTDHKDGYLLSADIDFISGYKKTSDKDLQSTKTLNIKDLDIFAEPNLFVFGNKNIGYIDFSEAEDFWFNEIYFRSDDKSIFVPQEDKEAFLEVIFQNPIKTNLPSSLDLSQKKVTPTAELNIFSAKEGSGQNFYVDLKFKYGDRSISFMSPNEKIPSLEEKSIYIRDFEEENKIYKLLPLHLTDLRINDEYPLLKAQNIKEFVTTTLALNIPLTIEQKKLETSDDFKFIVSSGLDWFDVEAQAGFSGRWVKFPSILESIKKGELFMPLSDGSYGFIDDSIKNRLDKISAFAQKDKDKLRFTSAQGLVLNSLLDEEKNLDLDKRFKALRSKIKNFSGIKPLKPSKSFKGKLRKYQQEGLSWLNFLNTFGLGGILADDMGLGKTIQCLAFLDYKKKSSKPSLLIAPKSVINNWQQEAQKFTPNMKVHIHAGSNRNTSEGLFKDFDIIIMTYQTMLKDFEVLKDISWDCIILDEAQAIKNPKAMISKAVKLLPANFQLALTGTPIENSIQDLFSISDFVNPGFLNGQRSSAHLMLSDQNRSALLKAIKPVVLRRTKNQVLKDLPDKVEQMIFVDLEAKQLKVYNELKRFYQSQLMNEVEQNGIKKSQIQILAALTRLRQAALHPGLIDDSKSKFKSAKFEVVLDMLAELTSEGHRVLIFSQFTSLLSLLKEQLHLRNIDFSYLDGKTNQRQQVIDDFKTSNCPVFLMSLKAGGVGLNLVEANYVFLLDPWWNPAIEAQAIDRVHRIGQTKAVNAYRFIAKNTVEEKILELQKTKQNLSNELFNQKTSSIKSLTVTDIENLFS